MAQLVRAFGSHPKGHRFESCWAHSCRWQACEAIRRPAKNTGFFAGFFVWGAAVCGCLRLPADVLGAPVGVPLGLSGPAR